MISVHQADMKAAVHVAMRLRPADYEEIAALLGDDFDRVELADASLKASGSYAWTIHEDDEPIGVWGVGGSPMRHIAMPWAWGTSRFVRAVPAITRMQHAVRADLAERGIRRLEIRSIVGHDLSRRWLTGTACGFHEEAILKGFGLKGQDFALFVRMLSQADVGDGECAWQAATG